MVKVNHDLRYNKIMSTDYDSALILGYTIPVEDFFKNHLQVREKVTRTEDRYCSKTGKKLKPVTVVVDDGGCDIVINGQTFKDQVESSELDESYCPGDDVLEAVGELLECTVSCVGHYDGGPMWVCLEPRGLPPVENGMLPISAVMEFAPFLKDIARRCQEFLNVDPGVGGVHTINTSC